MKLYELLDNVWDETWVYIEVESPGQLNTGYTLWAADYIGGDETEMQWLRPLLNREIDTIAVGTVDTGFGIDEMEYGICVTVI